MTEAIAILNNKKVKGNITFTSNNKNYIWSKI